MAQERTRTILGYVDNMPPLPPTLGKVVEIANDPHSCVADMDKIISMDPVLSAKVIKLVNSAYFGLQSKITTTMRAITHLGLNTIKNLALTAIVMKNLTESSRAAGISLDDFWRHSFACSIGAKILAKRANIPMHAVGDCTLAGLLHDIGKLVLANFSPEEYKKVVSYSLDNKVAFIASERKMLTAESRTMVQAGSDGGEPIVKTVLQPIDHCYIGWQLSMKWSLPEVLSDPVRFHHFPAECTSEVTAKIVNIIHVADVWCKMNDAGFAGDTYIPTIQDHTWKFIGVQMPELIQMQNEWNREMENAQEFLEIQSV